MVAAEVLCLDEENLIVATFDADDDGRGNGGVGFVVAGGADAGDVGMVGHRGTAFGTETAVLVPKGDLFGLACGGEQDAVHLEEKGAEVDSHERRGVSP